MQYNFFNLGATEKYKITKLINKKRLIAGNKRIIKYNGGKVNGIFI